ncbi:MAG: L-2-hydroxyglutarate oxidase [Cyclobacteriaceae bacterium]|nr:L-2-hydroxyglutarate oxidase [Cyclobacteriaceae bacterium]
MEKDIIIIGAGIVGLATAYRLNQKNPDLKILVIEKENGVSQHQTGHNSGVIHSGIYYRPGSLKAVNCISGYHRLLEFCDMNRISYDICGKIIVATSKEEIGRLYTLHERGQQNGLKGLKFLETEELKDYEPHVAGIAGLSVPQTGIIDFKEVSAKLLSILQKNGVEFRFGEMVKGIRKNKNSALVSSGNQENEARLVVNCGGLYSDKIARHTVPDLGVRIVPFRGEYFKIRDNRSYLVKNLIYPVPDPAFPFLGVHFTRMIHGGVEAGPNAVLAFAREGYKKSDINARELMEVLAWPGFQKVVKKYWRTGFGEMYRSFSKKAFTSALQKLVPGIREEDLMAGGSGVRAQACDRNGGLVDDFLIYENTISVNVCNAPSPAATSCFSIGETISEKVLAHFQ